MVVRATADKNEVLKDGKKIGSYFRMFNGKKYSYNGFETRKSEAVKIGKFRKENLGYGYRVIPVKGGYIFYTSQKRLF